MQKFIQSAAIAMFGLASCGGDGGVKPRKRGTQTRDVVAVTSGPAEWLAGLVMTTGQWDAVAESGARPATWRPDDAELDRLISARKILLVGEEFEPWTQRAGLPPSRVVTLVDLADPTRLLTTEGISHTHGTGPAHSHGGTVPTVWTDPDLLEALLPRMAEALGAKASTPKEIPGLSDYRAALDELKEAAAGRAIIASGHGLEYICRLTDLEVRVALLEPDKDGPTNDRGTHQLGGFAKKADDAGLLVWVDPPPAAFVDLAKKELGLTSVRFDLGGAAGGDTLRVLTESTQRLAGALKP